MTTEREQLEADLQQAQADLDAKRVHLAQAQAKVIDLQAQVASALAAVNAAQTKLDEYTEPDMDELERLRAELAEAEEEVAEWKYSLGIAQNNLDAAEQDHKVSVIAAAVAEREYNLANAAVDKSVADLNHSKLDVEGFQGLVSEAQAKVEAIQAKIDALDEPDDPPPPLPGDVYPLTINGKQWTFQTQPPADLAIQSHPRLVLPGRIDEIKRRMTAPAYADSYKAAKWRAGGNLWAALQYALTKNAVDGAAVKSWLLGLESKVTQDNEAGGVYWEICAYDWCNDLFTAEEREQIFTTLAMRIGIVEVVPGTDEFTIYFDPVHQYPAREKGDGWPPNWQFQNDHGDPSQAFGLTWRGVLALAFHGDGVRDEWCEYVYQRMLDGGDGRIFPIYDPVHGGLLDAHNQRALDSGGIQSGWSHYAVMDGYEHYFTSWMPHLMEAWCTATGDDLWTENNYFRLMPHRTAYRWHRGLKIAGRDQLTAALRMMTGFYAKRDPEMAGLARWICDTSGERGNYRQFEQFLWSDEEVPAKSPDEIPRMALGKTLRGDDICHSRSSWSPDATCVQMFIRTMDSHRYEPPATGLYIARKGMPLIMRGEGYKGSMRSASTAHVRIWETGTTPDDWGFGETYWAANHLKGPHALKPWVDRATSVIDVVTKPSYRGVEPTEEMHEMDGAYSVFGVDSAELRAGVDGRLNVNKAKRTIVHLRPNADGREFVVVYDRIDVGDGLSHCWQARFADQPTADATSWTAEYEGQALYGTVLSPGMAVEVRGGIPKVTEGPDGAVPEYINKLFYADGTHGERENCGEYAIYIQPDAIRQQQDYCVVLEVGDAGFVPVAATLSDKVVSVGGWSVDFTVEDQTKVSR